jgi:hypothetical protein
MDALLDIIKEKNIEIDRLKAENARLREENTDLEERIIKYWKECDLFEAENARLREALEDIAHCIYGNEATFQWVEKKAREALRGDITPDKGGE